MLRSCAKKSKQLSKTSPRNLNRSIDIPEQKRLAVILTMLQRATNLVKIQLLIFFLLVGCARLKQCAYEGLSRDQWQQRDRVIESLEIRPGDRVADIGSGGGYFVFALAKAVGANGKVYAVDIDQAMNDLVAQQAKKDGVGNIEMILAKPDDPLLPSFG